MYREFFGPAVGPFRIVICVNRRNDVLYDVAGVYTAIDEMDGRPDPIEGVVIERKGEAVVSSIVGQETVTGKTVMQTKEDAAVVQLPALAGTAFPAAGAGSLPREA